MKTILIAMTAVVLAGCAANAERPAPDVRIIDSVCSWAKPITIHPDDTEETKRQILEYDLALKRACPELF